MADATVTGCPNGPFMVSGPVKLHDAESNEISVHTDPIFLCICGRASKRPFCDGSYRDNGFEA